MIRLTIQTLGEGKITSRSREYGYPLPRIGEVMVADPISGKVVEIIHDFDDNVILITVDPNP